MNSADDIDNRSDSPLSMPSLFHRLLIAGVMPMLIIGCSAPPPNRVAIGGKATREGQPIAKAILTFQPADPSGGGQGGGGDVINGVYKISKESGPSPGQKYKVTVMTQPAKFLGGKEGKDAQSKPPTDEKQYSLVMEVDIPKTDTNNLDLDFK